MSERWVLLVAAHPRSSWFREVTRWASTAAAPIEVSVCLTSDQVTTALTSGRTHSAVLVDDGFADLERDLLATAHRRGVPTVVVGDPGRHDRWRRLGATGTLPASFGPEALLDALGDLARPVEQIPSPATLRTPQPVHARRARVITVTGVPGSGTSTLARAVAEGLGRSQATLLADLALHADQAVLHDVGDVVPGLPELLEACRFGDPDRTTPLEFCWSAEHLPHLLLLGLRHPSDWVTVRPAALSTALAWCAAAFEACVIDVDHDVEGEERTGSVDVEDRHRLARSALGWADVVLVTAPPDVRGIHRLSGLLRRLEEFGVDGSRLQPVFIGPTPRSGVRSAQRAVEQLRPSPAGHLATAVRRPAWFPTHRGVERAVRDARPLPHNLVTQAAALADAALRNAAPHTPTVEETPEPVAPGSLGHWYEDVP
ncbi:MAG: hypothetical protein JJU45_19080 [Acidimicrobiia bacterium]|nr:hypothetical protein [Acidimicrobiia bacterium]